MIRRPPRSTRTDPLFPYPTLFRSRGAAAGDARAGIGEKQGLLRQPVGVLEPDLDVDEMVRLAGERRAVEEIIGGVLRHAVDDGRVARSEEHTSELQSLMRISYAVFCLKTKNIILKFKLRNSIEVLFM